MSSGYKSRPSMFRNSTNISFADSISSYKAKSTTGRVDHDGSESFQSGRKIDPKFMTIQKDESHPSPKSSMPIDVKVETWLNHNEKTQIDFTKTASSVPTVQRQSRPPSSNTQPIRKPFFQHLKQLHSVKSATGTKKARSISASRATISNHEVSSTHEETPRHRKLSLREKLNKLHTPVPNSNWQTFDIHHSEFNANDPHDCCFKRNCESKIKLDHNVNLVNLCCAANYNRKGIITKPLLVSDPMLTDEDELEGSEKLHKKVMDKMNDTLDRSRLLVEQKSLIRMKQEIENFYTSRQPSDIKPICKLVFPIIIFMFISLSMFSIYFEIGIFTRLYNTMQSWFGPFAIAAMQRTRPPTKWELWSKFVKKCVEKMTNIGRKF